MSHPSASPSRTFVELADTDLKTLVACMLIESQSFPTSHLWFGLEVTQPDSSLWVARDERGDTLGYAVARAQQKVLHVIALAVDPACRRLGVGRALLRYAILQARARKLGALVLEVSTTNEAAIALYQSEGFTLKSVLSRYYSDGTDAYQMVRLSRSALRAQDRPN